MKNIFVLLTVMLLVCTEFSYADNSPGKPGAKVSFTDKKLIQIQPLIAQKITLELVSSADQLDFQLKASDGLGVELIDSDIYTKNKPFSIRVQMQSQYSGRFYIHCQVTTKTGDETLVSTISRVVVSSSDDTDQAAINATAPAPYDLRLHKTNSAGDYKILPATESVSTAVDKQDE
jgi:hypothetical protein